MGVGRGLALLSPNPEVTLSRRTVQVNGLIRQTLSDLLNQANDPRIKTLVSVTEVMTSPDLGQARVYVSAMGTEKERKEILKVLVGASGFLRRELGKRLEIKKVPALEFIPDQSLEAGGRLLRLIDKVGGEGDSPAASQ